MNSPGDSTGERISEIRECQQVHDTLWLTLLLGVVTALVLSARVGVVAGRPGPMLIGLFTYFTFYAAYKEAIKRIENPRLLELSLRVLHSSGTIFLGFLWLEAGGPSAPIFLMAFTLPLVTGNLLMLGGQAYVTGFVSTAVVAGVSLVASPGLRLQVGLPDGGGDWSNFDLTPSRIAVVFVSFTLVQWMLVISISSVRSNIDRLNLRLFASSRALEQIRTLFQAALRATPVPEVLVHTHTGRIVHASDAFLRLLADGGSAETSFHELVSFDAAGEVREAIEQRRPAEILTSYEIEKRKCIGNVVLYPIRYVGDDYVHVSLREESDIYLRMAIEAMDAAIIVADADERIAYFNRGAGELFATLRHGGSLDSILIAVGLPRAYLHLLTEPRSLTSAELAGVDYVVATSVIVRQDLGRLALLVIRQAARGGTSDIMNPFGIFYAPRYFTEAASLYLGSSEPKGSFALLEFETLADEIDDPSDEIRFVSTVESLLRHEDLFLGLRRPRFALLAPGSDPGDIEHILGQARELVSGSRSSRRFEVHHSVVSIFPGDDLDSLIRRAAATLPRALGEAVR